MPAARFSTRHLLSWTALLLAAVALELTLAYFRPLPFALMVAAVGMMAVVAWMRPGADLESGDARYHLLVGLLGLLYAAAPITATLPQRMVVAVPAVTVLAMSWPGARRAWFWTVLLIMLLSHAAHIVETAGLRSDVNVFFNAALGFLLHGQTVYRPVPMPQGPDMPLTYPPGALFVLGPSMLLTRDNRWALLVGEAVACALAWRLLPRDDAGHPAPWREALLLVPMVMPRIGEYFFEAANHEWVVLALIALTLILLRNGRQVLAATVLGLSFATKQTVLLYPGAFLLPHLRRPLRVLALAVAVALVVPFLLQDFHATVVAILDPNIHGANDQPNRLHAYGALYAAGVRPPSWLLAGLQALGLASGLIFWLRSRGSVPWALSCAGAGWLVLVLLSPYAGYNYYVYGLVLFAWGLALEASRVEGVGGAGIEPATSWV